MERQCEWCLADLTDVSVARHIYSGPNAGAVRVMQEVFCNRDHAAKWVIAVGEAIQPARWFANR